ncbi:hypothetical protein NIES2119_13205 [[Phormidium ambiguum] IAM M-71]|uniref:Uncharacterized protein n=2 Tax=[Phormidium ambiguum] IAM M-71 TaxID=454136 RepID=A0A1U7IKA7_9CYAN|nr:hypothetical protein NIES2119_13205 [Phormidium ambiguum IAM M-71]
MLALNNAYRYKDHQRSFKKIEPISGENKRAIAYSMDALVPGIYFWFGSWNLRLGGSRAEISYPGTVHSFAGLALVLPGYRIYSTYQGDYDPR